METGFICGFTRIDDVDGAKTELRDKRGRVRHLLNLLYAEKPEENSLTRVKQQAKVQVFERHLCKSSTALTRKAITLSAVSVCRHCVLDNKAEG